MKRILFSVLLALVFVPNAVGQAPVFTITEVTQDSVTLTFSGNPCGRQHRVRAAQRFSDGTWSSASLWQQFTFDPCPLPPPPPPPPPPEPPPPPPPPAECARTFTGGDFNAWASAAVPGNNCIGVSPVVQNLHTLTAAGTSTSPVVFRPAPPLTQVTLQGYFECEATCHDVVFEGIRFTRQGGGGESFSSIVYIRGDSITFRDNEFDGMGQDNCLLIGPGSRIVSNITVVRNRIHNCGAFDHEHSIYVENVNGYLISDNVIYEAGGYNIHLYPNADNGVVEYNVIDGAAKCLTGASGCWAVNVTFSGEGSQRSSNNEVRFNTISFPYPNPGYNVSDYSNDGQPNTVHENCVFGAVADFDTDSPSSPGYTQFNNLHADPQYANRAGGDFTIQNPACQAYGPRTIGG